jgi:hypothetical protein
VGGWVWVWDTYSALGLVKVSLVERCVEHNLLGLGHGCDGWWCAAASGVGGQGRVFHRVSGRARRWDVRRLQRFLGAQRVQRQPR